MSSSCLILIAAAIRDKGRRCDLRAGKCKSLELNVMMRLEATVNAELVVWRGVTLELFESDERGSQAVQGSLRVANVLSYYIRKLTWFRNPHVEALGAIIMHG